MSSYELFALADDLRRQAAACEKVRVDVDRIWLGLGDVLDGPVARHVPAVWQSAAADASRLMLRHQQAHLIRLRWEIESVARRLQARADELYADAGRAQMAAEVVQREEARELALQINYFQ